MTTRKEWKGWIVKKKKNNNNSKNKMIPYIFIKYKEGEREVETYYDSLQVT